MNQKANKEPKKHLTRAIIASDVTAMINCHEIDSDSIYRLVREFYAWKWSENVAEWGRKGKYEYCKYWSEEALNLWRNLKKPPTGKEVIHEHVVPRSVVAEKIKNLRKLNNPVRQETVSDIFEKWCFACVVLKREHKLLVEIKKGKTFNHPWLRYQNTSEITVGEIQEADKETWKEIRFEYSNRKGMKIVKK